MKKHKYARVTLRGGQVGYVELTQGVGPASFKRNLRYADWVEDIDGDWLRADAITTIRFLSKLPA